MPLLRWKLKKNIPFDAQEAVLSFTPQKARAAGTQVVTALVRQSILREYESVLESLGIHVGVVLNSSLAALSLVGENTRALLARVSGNSLTTAIVRDGQLCAYRCTELPAQGSDLSHRMLLDEIYPMTAYYEDAWHAPLQSVLFAGLGEATSGFLDLFRQELRCDVQPLLKGSSTPSALKGAEPLLKLELIGLMGWMANCA